MRKVITGCLRGNAYQFEQDAFDAVHAYLECAAAKYAANPDRAEIMADLEQAIADKCDTFLGKHKNVISTEEARQILREMGPVDGGTANDTAAPGAAAGSTTDSDPRANSTTGTRTAPGSTAGRQRLYRLPQEGMLGGVCAGLGAYFGIDVVWIRLAYVLITVFTGVWFFVWLAQLCVTPKGTAADFDSGTGNLRGAFGR